MKYDKRRYHLAVGLEVECLFHNPNEKIEVGGYHNGVRIPRTKWSTETDGSLRMRWGRMDQDWAAAEFVSDVFKSEVKMVKGIKQLFKRIGGFDKFDFSVEVGCGAHVHFDLIDTRNDGERVPMDRFLTMEHIQAIRTRVQQEIRERFPETYRSFQTRYFRDYAQRITHIDETRRLRGEFWWESYSPRKGMEYRSPTLHHCRSEQDVIDTYVIIYRTLYSVLTNGYVRKRNKAQGREVRIIGYVPQEFFRGVPTMETFTRRLRANQRRMEDGETARRTGQNV